MATILVIDDEAAHRRVVLAALAGQNHTLIEAANGVDGVDLARKHKPDLAIVDILMPEKEGIETMSDIREMAPATKFIAMSGGGISRSRLPLDMAKALGADATLAKPFRAAELTDTVARVLKATRAKTR
jgi:CheY-like chemotaxis protein